MISIHAPREGCDPSAWSTVWFPAISIHAPREGCDGVPLRGRGGCSGISIHAPREGCDARVTSRPWPPCDFNPRTPRGVRQHRSLFLIVRLVISIHAPREGCDRDAKTPEALRDEFQSTHPARGATVRLLVGVGGRQISIHAPREGCDGEAATEAAEESHFNPRTPRGVRPATTARTRPPTIFQSTHPARGATSNGTNYITDVVISIHAPREGCD